MFRVQGLGFRVRVGVWGGPLSNLAVVVVSDSYGVRSRKLCRFLASSFREH